MIESLNHLLEPFEPFRRDPSTTEIVVNRPGEIGVENSIGWTWHTDARLTFDRLDAIGILACYMASQDLSPANPLGRATLPGGERLQVCRPPATPENIVSLTIRKPSTTKSLIEHDDFDGLFSVTNMAGRYRERADEELIALYAQRNWREFFRRAIQVRKTIGVCGPTGSGKTHLLRRFLSAIPDASRIVTIEDTSEFGSAGPANRVNLFYGDGRAGLTAELVLQATLRMRPDRIIMQEVRGAEAFAFIRALAAGHPGGMTSWHADEGQEWDALELMVKQSDAGRAIPPEDLRRYLRQYIDVVIWVMRDDDGFKAPRVWFKAAEEVVA